ncbi:MAG: hypothetical protein EA428_12665 [Spirochaetaceae bacterium]|nr:MAG: hypothetical protein EA428_12665 [Spirochaetaceae bacterium]
MQPSENPDIAQLARELYPTESASFLAALDQTVEDWTATSRDAQAQQAADLANSAQAADPANPAMFSQQDVLLITYGDQFRSDIPKEKPLNALCQFAEQRLRELCSYIHILPFFPSTSDDGFAVSDYSRVDPELGDWEPITRTSGSFRMAFDLVLNHSSASHDWFRRFLAGESPYDRYYHQRPAEYDSAQVVRPRTHPLLTPFTRPNGEKVFVWTTFSEDQVDLNYSAPELMIEIIGILLLYISRGASMIRLDAIAYLWKEDGTTCIHHPNAHNAVKLFRALVDHLGLDTVLLTETNVPHQENISYFGNGSDEAHMVYNFALPPLTLEAFISGSATSLRRWAATLPQESGTTTFLNFLASHDGIGVTPATDWLSEERFDHLVETVAARGGRVSWKATPQGKVPYELNCNFFSAVADPDLPRDLRVRAFLSSQAIMLALAGVPGIYVHSLLGSESWEDGPEQLGHNRAINRQKLSLTQVDAELNDPGTLRHAVFSGFSQLIQARKRYSAFSPTARQVVLGTANSAAATTAAATAAARATTDAADATDADTPREVFAVLRESADSRVLCLTNCSAAEVVWPHGAPGSARDIVSGREVNVANGGVSLEPYLTLWLELRPEHHLGPRAGSAS